MKMLTRAALWLAAIMMFVSPLLASPNVTAPAGDIPAQAAAFGTLGGPATTVDQNNPLPVGVLLNAPSSFATPAGTTAYTAGTTPDLIANSGTATSVVPLTFLACRVSTGTGYVLRARIKTPDTGFAGQTVLLKLYKNSPTVTNGDNGAWLSTESEYIGTISVTLNQHFSDFEKGVGVPDIGNQIGFDCASASTSIYGLLVAGSAITPQGAKTISVVIEAMNN